MQFSGWWISWRMVDGTLGYGVGDDTMDRRWRATLDTYTYDPVAIANAADRAMHMLWHQEEREHRRRLERREWRVRALADRLIVTPGMLRDALRGDGKEGR